MLSETLVSLIPEGWENDPDMNGVAYVEYHLLEKHCNDAVMYRAVNGERVYRCRHENPNYKPE
jgi:hypothetical protein